MNDVAGPQSQAGEQEQDRPITLACPQRQVAGVDNALDLSRRQISRQCCEAPVRKCRDGSQEAWTAAANSDEKSQKHPKGRGTASGNRATARTVLVQNKLPQASRIQPVQICANA
jgi:hypothetical protein